MDDNRTYIDYTNIDRMHYIPKEKKDFSWLKDMLTIMELYGRPFVDVDEMQKCREFEKGIRDTHRAKMIIDPPTDTSNGGNPKNFASDFSANHIQVHINNIVDAKLSKSTKDIRLSCIDKYAYSKKMKENRKILERDVMIEIINEYNKQIGYPLLSPTDDPYKYIANEQNKIAKKQQAETKASQEGAPKEKEPKESVSNQPIGIVDYIKQMVNDSEGMALFNEYVYKDDVVTPIELGIEYYTEQNNLKVIEQKVHKDIRHANAIALRFYTSQVNGDPILQYLKPEDLITNPMPDDDYDCSGFEFGYIDMDMTYGEFMRTIGAKLNEEQLRAVFEANRKRGGSNKRMSELSRYEIEYTTIKIRYAEMLTQNVDVYSEYDHNGIYSLKPAKFNFKNKKDSPYKRVEKNYNVWYYCYAVPYATGGVGSVNGGNLIVDGGLLKDQQREGDDKRFSKSSFILYREKDKVPFTKIEMQYMEEINPLWDKIKNDIRQAMPHGTLFNWDALSTMLDTLEEGGNSKEALANLIGSIRQTGSGMLPERNSKGEPFSWITRDMHTGHIASAIEKLNMFSMLYQQMKQALGINDAMEGLDPKPRQALGGIEIASEASNNSRFYMTEMKDYMLVEIGYRFVCYFSDIIEEDGERFKKFADIVGYANELEIQVLRDIPLHRVGMYVDHRDEAEMSAMINNLALEASRRGEISMDTALFLMDINNIGYKRALLRLETKKTQQLMQEARASEAEAEKNKIMMEMEKEGMLSKMRQAEYEHKVKTDVMAEIALGKEKTKNQIAIKEEITKGRKEEATHDAKLELNKEATVAEDEMKSSEESFAPTSLDNSMQAPLPQIPQQQPQEQQQGLPQGINVEENFIDEQRNPTPQELANG